MEQILKLETDGAGDEKAKQSQDLPVDDDRPRSPNVLPGENATKISGMPTLNLLDWYPRICLTPNMLEAYAHLRGLTERNNDPVHQALFAGRDRSTSTQRLHLDCEGLDFFAPSLPKGIQLFWDPLVDVQQPSSVPRIRHEMPKADLEQGIDYDRYIKKFKPSARHIIPTGEDIWWNFDYCKLNGKWIDPDCVHCVRKVLSRRQKLSGLHVSPPMTASKGSNGPSLIDYGQQNLLYDDFLEYVSDEEGDPREHRIDAMTYVRFASGTKIGNFNVQRPRAENIQSIPRQKGVSGRLTRVPILPRHQYDEADRDASMSGILSDNSNPSVQESPRGFNLNIAPNRLSYMQPVLASRFPILGHEAHAAAVAYHGSDSLINKSSTFASTSSNLSSKATFSSPPSPHIQKSPKLIILEESKVIEILGESRFDAQGNEFNSLRQRYAEIEWENVLRCIHRDELTNARNQLRREFFQLRRYFGIEQQEGPRKDNQEVREVPTPSVDNEMGRVTGTDQSTNSLANIPIMNRQKSSDRQTRDSYERKELKRNRQRIERYIEEEKRRLNADIWREEQVQSTLEKQIEEVRVELLDLQDRRAMIVRSLDV